VPGAFQFNGRTHARGVQPITLNPRVVNGVDQACNTLGKDDWYFSFDCRLSRPFTFSTRASIVPTLEMFNTFNNDDNINRYRGHRCSASRAARGAAWAIHTGAARRQGDVLICQGVVLPTRPGCPSGSS